MGGYSPPPFLLAQEVHFFAGLGFGFSGKALGLPWWYGSVLILVVDLAKELTFDASWPPGIWPQGGEHQPFFPRPPAGYKNSGLVDWLFYLLGVLVATALVFGIPALSASP